MNNLTRKAVLKAIADFDEKGADEFFRHHQIQRSRSYFIRHGGQEYDMKAVVRIARGQILAVQPIHGPLDKSNVVARWLKALRFEIVHHKKTYDRASTEGHKYWIKQKNAERDPRLAGKAMKRNRKRHDGWIKCEACGFKDKGRSMFDAHHLSPLALGTRESDVDDLAVLCPTCHRWAHAKAGDRLHPCLSNKFAVGEA